MQTYLFKFEVFGHKKKFVARAPNEARARQELHAMIRKNTVIVDVNASGPEPKEKSTFEEVFDLLKKIKR